MDNNAAADLLEATAEGLMQLAKQLIGNVAILRSSPAPSSLYHQAEQQHNGKAKIRRNHWAKLPVNSYIEVPLADGPRLQKSASAYKGRHPGWNYRQATFVNSVRFTRLA